MVTRWLLTRAHDAVRWTLEPYSSDQTQPALCVFDSPQLAAASVAQGKPVSISEQYETALGHYHVIRIGGK